MFGYSGRKAHARIATLEHTLSTAANLALQDKVSAFGPYTLIVLGLIAAGIAAHFHWDAMDHLSGEVVACGITLMTQQVRAVLNNKEGGTVNLGTGSTLPPSSTTTPA